MKKILFTSILLALCFIHSLAFAAGTVVGSATTVTGSMHVLTLTCTGDSSDGSIPDTTTDALQDAAGSTGWATAFIKGFSLVGIFIENDSSDTNVTDDSDVYIKNSDGFDLLRGVGVDQLDDDTLNGPLLNSYESILGVITLDVDNQSVASGVYTITLIFEK